MSMRRIATQVLLFSAVCSLAACVHKPSPESVQKTQPANKGTLRLQTQPAGAQVTLDGKSLGNAPVVLTLNAGKHTVEASAKGYVPRLDQVTIAPGGQQQRRLILQRIAASVSVTTVPSGGDILFRGRMVRDRHHKLGRLVYGHYAVSASKSVDAITRLVGSKAFDVTARQSFMVKIHLRKKQRLYEGDWLPYATALAREQQRYRSQAVPNPVHLTAVLSSHDLKALRRQKHLAAELMQVMRVGDRITLKSGGRQWTLWKRSHKESTAFDVDVTAFMKGTTQPFAWPEDAAKQVSISAGSFGDIIYHLQRARSRYALLDLDQGELKKGGAEVLRAKADGALTILAIGGTKLSVSAATLNRVADIRLLRVKAASSPLQIHWASRPKQLLVIGDTGWNMAAASVPHALKRGEKQDFRLVKGGHVSELIRFSEGPDFDGWQREVLAASGPMAGQLDYSHDEIGPDNVPGHYRRSWIVRFGQGATASQRQVDCSYIVGKQKEQVETDLFLRRNRLSEEPNK